MKREWTQEETSVLKEMFNSSSKGDIIKRLNRSWPSIKNMAQKLVLKRKRMIKCKMLPGTNHTFFDSWSQDMAYVLGFIAADGNVSQSGKYMKLKLAEKDLAHLIVIRDIVAPNAKIKYSSYIKNGKAFPDVTFVACSTYMCARLISLGIVPAKSLVLKFPDVPNEYVSHFIRGYFDGDGC